MKTDKRLPLALLVEKDPDNPDATPHVIYCEYTDPVIDFHVLPNLVDEYTSDGWAVRVEGEYGVEWNFRVGSTGDGFSGGELHPFSSYDDEEGRTIADQIEKEIGYPLPVLYVYEYDPNSLTHAVLLSNAVEYTGRDQ